ncbi:MAG: hypothetical protein K0S16_856 [Moraxellaceae bacterium]|nr:hypothetical protein [Moraxellaceae bacterium]
MAQSGNKKGVFADAFFIGTVQLEFGGSCRDRTYDQWIKSPLLYQLS